jgi:hypothetical protein
MEFLFSSIDAWSQTGLILGGLFLFFFALALIGDFLWWQIKSSPYKGTITGLRAKPGTRNLIYYPIVQYKNNVGETISAEANHGSSFLVNQVPGNEINILIMDSDKQTFRVKSSFWLGTGAFSFVLCFFLFYISFSSYDFTLYTALILVGFFGAAFFKVQRIISKKGLESVIDFRSKRLAEKKIKREEYPLLGRQQVLNEIKKRDQINIKCLPFSLIFGILILGTAMQLGLDQKYMVEAGVRTQGEVVKIYTSKSAEEENVSYYPIVEFLDQEERSITFKDKVGSNPSYYNVGEKVTVLFDPDKLGKAMIDKGVGNWFPCLLLLFFGGFLVWISINKLFEIRSRVTESPNGLLI